MGHYIYITVFALLLMSCASDGPVLTPVVDPNKALPPEETLNNPTYQKLATLLSQLGYSGVGMQYESAATQEMFTKVFNDSRTHQKDIDLIYTGAVLSYDPRYKSLTVSTVKDAETLIQFIAAKVPARKPKTPPKS